MDYQTLASSQERSLLRLAYVLCQDHHLAEDLVQATFMEAFRKWRLVRRADDPAAYLSRMLVNAHVSRLRRSSSWEIPVADDRDDTEVDTAYDAVADRDALARAMRELPERQRLVLVLRYYLDLADPEIARSLGCAQATVRSSAARALASLRNDINLAHVKEPS